MRFSVVIPTYNRVDTLRQTLAAVSAQDRSDYDILVIDDGSTDATAETVAQEFPGVRLLRQPNRGPAAARNRGIHEATGDVVAFTDDDCVPPPDWLSRLAAGYGRYPHIAGAGGYLEAPDALMRLNLLAQFERSIGRDEYGAGQEEMVGGFECPAGGTNNMSYRRSVLLHAGGFDETFPYAAGEDADLKWRVCQTGARLLYMPVKVKHLQPYTWRHFRRQYITRGRGVVHFERKHRGHPPSLTRVLLRFARRLIQLPLDSIRGPQRRMTFVRFAAGWYDCVGQLIEFQNLRR